MKHPVLENRVRLIVWWLAWLFIAAGQSLLFYYAFGIISPISIIDSLVSLVIYSGIALSLWYPFRFFNEGKKPALTLISNIVLEGAASISIWMLVTKFVMTVALSDQASYSQYWDATFPYRVGTGVLIYGLIILSYYLFDSLRNLSLKKVREARLESLVKETELKLLRSQINPHFLFNSLNSVSSLTITDPEKARIMVVKLSDFLRYSLSRKDDQPVPLRSELDNLRLYLDIEKVRFGERLDTEEHITDECLDVKIPILLLQPLYENAIKHGVYESTEVVRIVTRAEIENGYLVLNISNNYSDGPRQKKGTGTGLQNVTRRLELSFGKTSSVKTSFGEGVFSVKLYIPVNQGK